MIHRKKAIVIDIDGTLCPTKKSEESYADMKIYPEVLKTLMEYRKNGFYIILTTSRNMRTYGGNIGLIFANTAPVLLEWLKQNSVPYDEIHFGKPWPGEGGFYVDDKAIRPREFIKMSYEQIQALLDAEKSCNIT